MAYRRVKGPVTVAHVNDQIVIIGGRNIRVAVIVKVSRSDSIGHIAVMGFEGPLFKRSVDLAKVHRNRLVGIRRNNKVGQSVIVEIADAV